MSTGKSMKVFITGGTGFVGSHLIRHFREKNHQVVVTGTRADSVRNDGDGVDYIQADTTKTGPWQKAVTDADLIVNLAGKTIFHRWSRKYKKQLYSSRIQTTHNLVAAMAGGNGQTLISTSAVGYYGNAGENILPEDAPKGRDFLSDLSKDWEAEALTARSKNARVVITRFGIVMGKEGGALHTLLTAFKSFVGGPLGSGKQWVSWIHIQDIVAAIDHLAQQTDLAGTFNLCAPNPIRNKEMSAMIGTTMGRPSKVAAPALALKLAMGELADVLLASQRAVPERLLASGFDFQFPRLKGALEDLIL
jgi:uncharacterized protein (TIGR01777 family)